MLLTEIIIMLHTFNLITAMKRYRFVIWAIFYNVCVLITCILFWNEYMDNALLYSNDWLPPQNTLMSDEYYLFFNVVKFGGLLINLLVLFKVNTNTKSTARSEFLTIRIMIPLSIAIFLFFWNKIIICILEGWLIFIVCLVRRYIYCNSTNSNNRNNDN